MQKKIILSAQDIEVKFKVRDRELTAIRGVSLDLYEGETLAIVGESGSGKSVFTKTFTGMLEENGIVSRGKVIFEDEDLLQYKGHNEWQKIRGRKISTVFQDPMTSLNPVLTIGEQISEVIRRHQGASAEEAKLRAIDLMGKVGIPDPESRYKEYPFMYSGGMRQRIVIAAALACRPRILICDEPTTALDVTIQAQIIQLINRLSKEFGFTIIYITHDLGVVANVADKVAVMYAGQIVEYGTVEEIFYDPRHPYTWGLLSSLPQLGNREDDLYAIPGTPPSLFEKIVGDAYALRSPYAMQIDFEEEPPCFQITPTHYAKTWLLDERAPKVDPPKIIKALHEKMQLIKSEGEENNV